MKTHLFALSLAATMALPAAFAREPVSARSERILRHEYRLPRITNEITKRAVRDQSARLRNTVRFDVALREAMESFLNDGSDVESPLAIATEEALDAMHESYGPDGSVSPAVRRRAKRILLDLLNRPDTTIRLLDLGEKAEHGEPTQKFWIFSLSIPDQSDHGHWAVVDRRGKEKTYNYGFN